MSSSFSFDLYCTHHCFNSRAAIFILTVMLLCCLPGLMLYVTT